MSTKHFMKIDSSETLLVTRICANASGEGLSKSAEIPIRVQNDLGELLAAWICGAAAVCGLKYDGTTTTRPSNGNDGVNTIGYGHLSWVHNNWVPAAVFATPYVNDNDRIKDADMLRLCNLCPVGYIPQFFLEPLGQRVTTAFRYLAPTRHR